MRFDKQKIIIVALLICIFLGLYFFVYPIVTMYQATTDVALTNVAYRNDYKLHTTPLPEDVVNDICSKLNIKGISEHCQPGAVVFAPDFLDELKVYFYNLSDQEKTSIMVQDHLGKYLVVCEEPDPNGYYRCKYDLRGDKVYPFFFLFDSKGYYYEIIGGVGGS